jgi:hypothetical protein
LDILGVSGVTDVIFYAGTNDFGDGIPASQSIASLQSMVAILHAHGIRAIGATLISNVGQAGTNEATYVAHNTINAFIRAPGSFDKPCRFLSRDRGPKQHGFLWQSDPLPAIRDPQRSEWHPRLPARRPR